MSSRTLRSDLEVCLPPAPVLVNAVEGLRYGFYSYQEPDVVFTGLDINPFTNQSVRNSVVQFYLKNDGAMSAASFFGIITVLQGLNGRVPGLRKTAVISAHAGVSIHRGSAS